MKNQLSFTFMSHPAYKIVCFFLLFALPAFVMAQKNDKVYLRNGDVITGEIKSMKFAKLRFDMTGPGLIEIKWEEIMQLRSNQTFQLTIRTGEVMVTRLDSVLFETRHLTLEDIVEIVRIKDRFLHRLEGDIDLGFNYTKSNSLFQFNLGTSVTYRRPKTETALKVNSVLSRSSNDSILSKKQDATLNYFHKLKNNYFLNMILAWQQNTQLGLANRFLITGAAGKILVVNNHQRLTVGTGLSTNLEQSSESISYKNNLEALATIQFKQFRYSSPKISIDANYTIYPGLSDWGRVRMDFQVNTKIEIFKDFFTGLSFYDLYDNRPPQGAVSKNDYGINFTVGYEFGK